MNNFLLNICKVGERGEQAIYTCKYLNRNLRGYFCMKLSEQKDEVAKSAGLKGDYCEGMSANQNLELWKL